MGAHAAIQNAGPPMPPKPSLGQAKPDPRFSPAKPDGASPSRSPCSLCRYFYRGLRRQRFGMGAHAAIQNAGPPMPPKPSLGQAKPDPRFSPAKPDGASPSRSLCSLGIYFIRRRLSPFQVPIHFSSLLKARENTLLSNRPSWVVKVCHCFPSNQLTPPSVPAHRFPS